MPGRLFTPLLPTLGLNSNAAEVVSILLIRASSREYLTQVFFSTGQIVEQARSNSLVLRFSSHLASFVSSIGD